MEKSARNKIIPFYVLIAAAGTGARLGGTLPKQYQKIAGKTVLWHTIKRFINCPGCQGIKVIIHPDHETLYTQSVADLKLMEFSYGSKTRKESIYNGLDSFSNLDNKDIVLIHDAARPFVTQDEILDLVEAIEKNGAATLATPVVDTLFKSENRSYIERDGLCSVQTPQGFHYGLVFDSHKKAEKDVNFTDDTSIVTAQGHDVVIVTGGRQNFKITTAEDMDLARTLIEGKTMPRTRTGMGFDVHSFDKSEAANSVRLCGVDVPHPHRLAGHSDADVGLHAITDAVLGAIGAGDIGQHFPPSDDRWKGADSSIFLKKAADLVREQQGQIANIDVTLICERPKITPYCDAMKKAIAHICDLQENQINVKATTTEKLGFTGREEGIAAQAVATVEML